MICGSDISVNSIYTGVNRLKVKKILFCKWNGCAEYGMQKALESMGYEVESITYAFNGADYSGDCLQMLGKA